MADRDKRQKTRDGRKREGKGVNTIRNQEKRGKGKISYGIRRKQQINAMKENEVVQLHTKDGCGGYNKKVCVNGASGEGR